MNNESQIQEKYIELQLLEQKMQQIQQQSILIEQKILELTSLEESLDEVKNLKKGQVILSPLGSGIFLKSEVEDSEELFVNVGSNVVVKKNVSKTKELINKQIQDLKEFNNDLEKELQKASVEGKELQLELQRLVSQD